MAKDYWPLFFLGEAHYNRGRCTEALTAWQESLSLGRIKGHKEYFGILQKELADCNAKGYLLDRDWTALHQETEHLINLADAALSEFNKLLTQHVDSVPADVRLMQVKAQLDLDEARKKWQTGRSTRFKGDFESAKEKATSSREGFITARSTLEAFDRSRKTREAAPSNPTAEPGSKGEAPAPLPPDGVTRVRQGYESAGRRLKRVLDEFGKLAPEARSAGVSRAVEAANSAWQSGYAEFQAALEPPNLERFKNAEQQLRTLRGDLDKLDKAFPMPITVAPTAIPPLLMSGADLFFQGKYDQAVEALTEDVAASTGAELLPHLLVIRAAAHYALYVRSGEKDAARLELAIADVKSCKALKSDFQPPADTFSPRFRDFFAKTQ